MEFKGGIGRIRKKNRIKTFINIWHHIYHCSLSSDTSKRDTAWELNEYGGEDGWQSPNQKEVGQV